MRVVFRRRRAMSTESGMFCCISVVFHSFKEHIVIVDKVSFRYRSIYMNQLRNTTLYKQVRCYIKFKLNFEIYTSLESPCLPHHNEGKLLISESNH